MTRALPRTNFNSSRLIRFLADLAVVDAPETGHDSAEKLALWLDFTDAITLSAVHDASPPDTPAGGQSVASTAWAEEFARARADLVNTITQSCMPNGAATRIKLPTSPLDAAIESAAAYEPYRRFYLAQQREMELNLGPLRARVREALAKASPTLNKLAALDEALDGALRARESKLLATVPVLLDKRFEQLRKAHQQTLLDSGHADDPALWMQPGGWLANFCRELQGVLLAELDLRLQPAVGLIEALSNEVSKKNE
jgi:hypothetical protein